MYDSSAVFPQGILFKSIGATTILKSDEGQQIALEGESKSLSTHVRDECWWRGVHSFELSIRFYLSGDQWHVVRVVDS